ncbi:MAG: BlaI/MecI/CopY family transcriptional regulator [Oscillospiraceae bacterium]|nr:BlaI/MecI/CopY family transcriptional regulator [Oscillospiraceae bacterium]
MSTTIERIPDAELEVMLVLWHAEKPQSVSEITGKLAETRPWKAGTVHVLLARLEERGFVACDKSEYKHQFSPVITEKAYRKGEERTMLDRFFGGSPKKMIASLLDTDGLSDKDLEELTVLLKRKKGE